MERTPVPGVDRITDAREDYLIPKIDGQKSTAPSGMPRPGPTFDFMTPA